MTAATAGEDGTGHRVAHAAQAAQTEQPAQAAHLPRAAQVPQPTAPAQPPHPARVALVTGASRGIGRAIAEALAESGHRVAVGFASDAAGAEECVKTLCAAGADAMAVQANVGVRAEVDDMFARVEAAWGPVEVLVNNAGMLRDGLAVSLSDEDWSAVLRTNLDGAFFCMRRALRTMVRARWGRVVSVGSVVGVSGSAGQANYAASKAGLIGLTQTVAREVAGRRVTVNTVLPGPVDTALIGHLPDAGRDRLRDLVPMNRFGEPAEIAAAVAFLCSPAASFVTGVALPVDGGFLAGR